MATHPLCFNCNIALYANRQSYDILDMSPDIVSLLEEWTTREVITTDRLCHECFNLVIAELYASNPRPEQQVGHHSLCVNCGISLAQRSGRQSRPLPEGHPERSYIADVIFPRLIPVDARVCNRCWQQAHYRVQNKANVHDPVVEHGDVHESASQTEKDEPIPTMMLQNYSRTPDTANHCFVPECQNIERLRVSIYLRRRILSEYKLFISSNSRICQEHSNIYNWDILSDYEFMREFTSTHIEEMLNLLAQ